jgi:hypothetical protein
MVDKLKLMTILAHPDDASLGNGGMLAKYAAEGSEEGDLCGRPGLPSRGESISYETNFRLLFR